MKTIYGKIKIELMSDLCAGSGYSYAGVIDSDASYDAWGIPYLPARRLKGCMREAAELVCPDTVEALFGRRGDNGVKGFTLGNAYIQDYEMITKELQGLRRTKKKEAVFLSPQNILRMYTNVRAQTKLNRETKTAEENTLRYTRVVGQYDPRRNEKNHLCFYAEIRYGEAYGNDIARIAKAVRNLGMNRNRGLGSVHCSLVEREVVQENTKGVVGKEEDRVCLTYVLRNQLPLLMCSDNDGSSDSYISGKSILGILAGAYLGMDEKTAESEEFCELFLNGNTLFTDANPTCLPEDGKENANKWPEYFPVPLYLNRLKKTKALVNFLAEEKIPAGEEVDYDTGDGNIPKKLKGYYVHEAGQNVYELTEPEKEIIFHNSQDNGLYALEALAADQYFEGKIYAKRKHAELLKLLLESSHLSFGKSKAAQYGSCVPSAKIIIDDDLLAVHCAEERERVAVLLVSDGIFLDEAAGYTVKFDDVKRLIGKNLEIPYEKRDDWSIVQTREITGYHTAWNLHRPGIPAVKAGSVLVYTIPQGMRWEKKLSMGECFVGERNLEGYGRVQIVNCKQMQYAVHRAKEETRDEEPEESAVLHNTKLFLVKILTERLLERLVFLYTKSSSQLNLTASTVGRLSLMLQESVYENRGDAGKTLKDFCDRIDSIKRPKEKAEAIRLMEEVMPVGAFEKKIYKLALEKFASDKGDDEVKEIKELLQQHSTKEEYEKILYDIWEIYMEQVLTYHKYLKKHEGDSKNE